MQIENSIERIMDFELNLSQQQIPIDKKNASNISLLKTVISFLNT